MSPKIGGMGNDCFCVLLYTDKQISLGLSLSSNFLPSLIAFVIFTFMSKTVLLRSEKKALSFEMSPDSGRL